MTTELRGWRYGSFAVVVAWVASGLALGRTLVPDVSLYVSGAPGEPFWFPSPGGRFLGSGGAAFLGLVSLVSALYLGASVASRSSAPRRSTLMLLLFPASWYLGALGVALPALALASRGRGVIAALVHPATAVCWVVSRRAWVSGLAVSVVLFLTTAYAAAGAPDVGDRMFALGVGSLLAVVLWLVSSCALEVGVSAAVGVLLMAAVGDIQVRYLLPAVLIGALR